MEASEVQHSLPPAVINSMLRENVLPSSALLRVLALIPGVTQSTDPVDFDGRPAIAVGMVQDGWRHEDILLDPTTHEFLGCRTVVVKDHTTPEGVRLKEGDVEVELIRITGKIVARRARPADHRVRRHALADLP